MRVGKLNPIHGEGQGGYFGHPFQILSHTFKQVQVQGWY